MTDQQPTDDQAEHPLLAPEWAERLVAQQFGETLEICKTISIDAADILLEIAAIPADSFASGLVNAVLFRTCLTSYDGVLLCLRGGAGETAQLPLRALMEARWGLLLALTLPREAVGRHLLVRSLREQLHWALRAIPETKESRAFPEAFAVLHGIDGPKQDVIDKARQAAREYGKRLGDDRLAPVNALFEEYANKWHHDPPWYYLLSDPAERRIDTLIGLARRVGALNEYFTVYRYAAAVAHGGHVGNALKRTEDGVQAIHYVRTPDDWRMPMKLATSQFADTVRRMVSSYLGPDRATVFAQRYSLEWLPILDRTPEFRIRYGKRPRS